MNRIITIAAIVGMYLILGCTKQSPVVDSTTTPQATGKTGFNAHAAARFTGTDGYSQPISLDLANRMIGSYLTSVGYPGVDNSLRSLSFDADSMRAYLSNPNIKTIRFVMAHQPTWTSSNYGQFAGMNPAALTMVVVGMGEQNQTILNSSNGVYEHMNACPMICPVGDAYIHN